jgi:3'(2'), 5'-bisphosphate nucleotidase
MFNPEDILQLAKDAGDAVMAIYGRDFAVYEKEDRTPLTEADLTSHRVLVEGLGRITPEIPVLSEESVESHSAGRLEWSRYWLIDPLDGTREFVRKNGEFTVNVALVENGRPVFGVVHAPALNVTYWGKAGEGAYKQTDDGRASRISVTTPPAGRDGWRVVGSRSHQSDAFRAFMERLPGAEMVAMGSSLKLCLVAEGAADLYPRLGLTSEWDTAAAQAVVEAAGGQVLEYPGLEPLRYNTRPETLLNPHFIVCNRPSEVWTAAR